MKYFWMLRYPAVWFLPSLCVAYGAFGTGVWAGRAANLFTGWSVFCFVAGFLVLVGFNVAEEMVRDGAFTEEQLDETVNRSCWRKFFGRTTATFELGVVVMMGWWWTAFFYGFGWAFEEIGRSIGRDKLEAMRDRDEFDEAIDRAIEKTAKKFEEQDPLAN
jgi:hypothetical protein